MKRLISIILIQAFFLTNLGIGVSDINRSSLRRQVRQEQVKRRKPLGKVTFSGNVVIDKGLSKIEQEAVKSHEFSHILSFNLIKHNWGVWDEIEFAFTRSRQWDDLLRELFRIRVNITYKKPLLDKQIDKLSKEDLEHILTTSREFGFNDKGGRKPSEITNRPETNWVVEILGLWAGASAKSTHQVWHTMCVELVVGVNGVVERKRGLFEKAGYIRIEDKDVWSWYRSLMRKISGSFIVYTQSHLEELTRNMDAGGVGEMAWCWREKVPEKEDFEEIKSDYEEMEDEVINTVLDDLEEEGVIDEDEREEIAEELKDVLNEDIIGNKLLPEALNGELDDIDEERLLDAVISVLMARFKVKYGIELSYDKLKELLKDKESLKKFLKTFREKVIDKIKKDKNNGSSSRGGSGGKTKTIFPQKIKSRPISPDRFTNNLGITKSVRNLSDRILGRIGTIVSGLRAAAQDIFRDFLRYSPFNIRVGLLDTGIGNVQFPFIFFADTDDNNSTQPPSGFGVLLNQLAPQQINSGDFYEDMLEKVQNNEYDPFVMGAKQTANLDAIINRITKPKMAGVFLQGDAGTGKTAIAEELARMIAERRTNTWLDDRSITSAKPPVRLLKLKIASFVDTGNIINTEKLSLLLDDVADGRTVLFIDEAHILAQQPPGTTDFFNYIKDKLTGGKLRIIISTTKEETEMFLSKDKAMSQRFKTVEIEAPDTGETVEILEGIAPELLKEVNTEDIPQEKYISVPENRIYRFFRTLVKLTNRFKTGFGRPRGPIDAFRETLNWIRQRQGQNKRRMDSFKEQIVKALNNLISLRRKDSDDEDTVERRKREARKAINAINSLFKAFKERDKAFRYKAETADIVEANRFTAGSEDVDDEKWILGIEERLKRRVHGQDSAIKEISKTVITDRRGIRKRNRPAGIFYLAGPTGCGKTYIPQVLAEELYPGDEKAFIRIDMTEYREPYRITELIGAPKAYIGSDKPPLLLKMVKERPYSVIVFDEADKAHPLVFDFLLNVLETGSYKGIDFSKTFLFFTSNENLTTADYRKPAKEIKEKIKKSIEENYRPEFLNRLRNMGKILILNFLSKKKMVGIVQKNFIKDVQEDFKEETGAEVILDKGEEQFVNSEQFTINTGYPWAMSDNGLIIGYDEERRTLSESRREDELKLSEEETEDKEGAQQSSFEENVLSDPAMIRLVQENGKITSYFIADRDLGIVHIGQDGKFIGTLGESSDIVEIAGDRIYYRSIEDGTIKSCNFDNSDIKEIFNPANSAIGEIISFGAAVGEEKGISICIIDGNARVFLIGEDGKIGRQSALEHTDKFIKGQSNIRTLLKEILSSDASDGTYTAKNGDKYKFDGSAVLKTASNGTQTRINLGGSKQTGFLHENSSKSVYLNRVLADKTGSVYLYNTQTDTVEKYNRHGRLIKSSVGLGEAVEDISDIGIDDKGRIYLLDTEARCILTLNPRLQIETKTSSANPMAHPELKVIPLDEIDDLDNTQIYIDGNRIYLYNSAEQKIIELDKKGRIVDTAEAVAVQEINTAAVIRYKGRWRVSDTRGNLFVLDDTLKIVEEVPAMDRQGDYKLMLSNGSLLLTDISKNDIRVFADIEINPVAELIMEKGFSKTSGARGVEGAGRRLLIDPLNELYAKGEITKGSRIIVRREGNKLKFLRSRKQETPNPKALLTQMSNDVQDFDRILTEIEERINLILDSRGSFSIEDLEGILDFKPRNLAGAENFKPKTPLKNNGKVIRSSEETLNDNSLTERNYNAFSGKVKQLLEPADNDIKKAIAGLIKETVALCKLMHLDTAAREERGIRNFTELEEWLIETETGLNSAAGQPDDIKENLQKQKEALEKRRDEIISRANELFSINLQYQVTDKNELALTAESRRRLSLEEEEHLIELFTAEPDAQGSFDSAFSNERDRSFAKKRSAFLSLPGAVSGYEKTRDGRLVLWFKLPVEKLTKDEGRPLASLTGTRDELRQKLEQIEKEQKKIQAEIENLKQKKPTGKEDDLESSRFEEVTKMLLSMGGVFEGEFGHRILKFGLSWRNITNRLNLEHKTETYKHGFVTEGIQHSFVLKLFPGVSAYELLTFVLKQEDFWDDSEKGVVPTFHREKIKAKLKEWGESPAATTQPLASLTNRLEELEKKKEGYELSLRAERGNPAANAKQFAEMKKEIEQRLKGIEKDSENSPNIVRRAETVFVDGERIEGISDTITNSRSPSINDKGEIAVQLEIDNKWIIAYIRKEGGKWKAETVFTDGERIEGIDGTITNSRSLSLNDKREIAVQLEIENKWRTAYIRKEGGKWKAEKVFAHGERIEGISGTIANSSYPSINDKEDIAVRLKIDDKWRVAIIEITNSYQGDKEYFNQLLSLLSSLSASGLSEEILEKFRAAMDVTEAEREAVLMELRVLVEELTKDEGRSFASLTGTRDDNRISNNELVSPSALCKTWHGKKRIEERSGGLDFRSVIRDEEGNRYAAVWGKGGVVRDGETGTGSFEKRKSGVYILKNGSNEWEHLKGFEKKCTGIAKYKDWLYASGDKDDVYLFRKDGDGWRKRGEVCFVNGPYRLAASKDGYLYGISRDKIYKYKINENGMVGFDNPADEIEAVDVQNITVTDNGEVYFNRGGNVYRWDMERKRKVYIGGFSANADAYYISNLPDGSLLVTSSWSDIYLVPRDKLPPQDLSGITDEDAKKPYISDTSGYKLTLEYEEDDEKRKIFREIYSFESEGNVVIEAMHSNSDYLTASCEFFAFTPDEEELRRGTNYKVTLGKGYDVPEDMVDFAVGDEGEVSYIQLHTYVSEALPSGEYTNVFYTAMDSYKNFDLVVRRIEEASKDYISVKKRDIPSNAIRFSEVINASNGFKNVRDIAVAEDIGDIAVLDDDGVHILRKNQSTGKYVYRGDNDLVRRALNDIAPEDVFSIDMDKDGTLFLIKQDNRHDRDLFMVVDIIGRDGRRREPIEDKDNINNIGILKGKKLIAVSDDYIFIMGRDIYCFDKSTGEPLKELDEAIDELLKKNNINQEKDISRIKARGDTLYIYSSKDNKVYPLKNLPQPLFKKVSSANAKVASRKRTAKEVDEAI